MELRNPHSVLAALTARPDAVQALRLGRERAAGAWKEAARLARAHGIPVEIGPVEERRGRPRGQSAPHAKEGREGNAHALVAARDPAPLDDLLGAGPMERGLWLALDSIHDPRNVGAIFRSAAFFGVQGVILTSDRAAPLTAISYDAASGGLELVPFAIETNLRRALQQAKDTGLWVLGTSEHAAQRVQDVPRDRSWILVVGNEEQGLRRLTLEACDAVCAIGPPPAAGERLASLNVSVATGILLAMLSRVP